MFLTIFIICFSYSVLASPVPQEYDMEDIEKLKYIYNEYKVKFNKSYAAEEERLRFQYFKENLAIINDLNRRNNPMTVFGVNKFTDWSAEEKQNLLGFDGSNRDGYGSCSVGNASDIKTASLSDAIDWRDKNAVAPVQNQGSCGACWAFTAAAVTRRQSAQNASSIATLNSNAYSLTEIKASILITCGLDEKFAVLEGAYAIKHNTLLKLSEQQFVDCDSASSGCAGGAVDKAITSTMQLGGQELENDYPYKGQQDECQFDVNKAKVKASSCKVFAQIGDSDDRLANLLASAGPLGILLDGNADIFHNYHDGIIIDCKGSTVTHAVTLIGYGEEKGTPYWIIKNSWGPEWGENGFVRVQRGVGCLLLGGYALTADVA